MLVKSNLLPLPSRMRTIQLSQRGRFIALVVEIGVLLLVSYFISNSFFPSPGGSGFWFYAALLGLVLGSRLDTPYFVKPADVVLYAAPAAIALLLESNLSNWSPLVRNCYYVALGYSMTMGLIAVVAILTQSRTRTRLGKISETAKIIAEHLGTPRFIFSFLLGFALVAYHRSSPREIILISFAWVLLVWMNPIDLIFTIFQRVRGVLNRELAQLADGKTIAFRAPGIILIQPGPQIAVGPRDLVAIRDAAGTPRAALLLDQVGHAEGDLWRAIEIPEGRADAGIAEKISLLENESFVRLSENQSLANAQLATLGEKLVGLVAEKTSVQELYFDLVSPDGVEEGRLVCVHFSKRDVMYQVVNGLTREEVVIQKATFGFVRAQARKVGFWDGDAHRFRNAKWVPPMNAAVTIEPVSEFRHVPECVGHFPQTAFGVRLRSNGDSPTGLHAMVTHNTAILGILGVGKSSLAIELVERMMVAGIKIICIDLTNQYATELQPYYHAPRHEKMRQGLNKVGAAGKKVYSKNQDEGGSVRKFTSTLDAILRKFIAPDHPLRLLILNPADFEVWQQDGKQFKDDAVPGMSVLTPAEITQIITESALRAASSLGMTAAARICVVFEEAHSLVPEWNSAVHDGEKAAANGTARAILQGRKFGMGCLLISQRTANVTKTILNQCNTVFAMRTFDDTGKEFLANYLGKEFATMLPSLEERHAIFFGRGSACENPVLLRLNDRGPWLTAFRTVNPPPALPAEPANEVADAGEALIAEKEPQA